ncbi:transposable element Tcb1 transposase [Trichonephila clavipes]|nr:transposable element Tcb1 transposase [Trichonephila clavipes]
MTGHIFRDVILEQHVRLFRGAMGAEFLFMDDNARPHRANIVDECLQSEDIPCMDWPACSPDFKPIEHVWDMLDRRIAARQPPPTCLPELRRVFLDEWCNIPQDQIDNLILSMPRRLDKRSRYIPWNIQTPKHSGITFRRLATTIRMFEALRFLSTYLRKEHRSLRGRKKRQTLVKEKEPSILPNAKGLLQPDS